MPCPISTWGIPRVVRPASSMRMKAFGANLPAVSSAGCTGSLTARTGRWNASKNPPAKPPVNRPRREIRSGILCATLMARPSRLTPGSSLLDCGANAHISATATDISRHRGIDIRIIRIERRCEQGCRRHDLARLAIAALDHFEIEPGLLHLCTGRRGADTFDGGDGAITNGSHRQHTGTHRLAIDMHRAGAALGDAAAEFRSGHAEHVAQNPEQGHIRRSIERFLLAVD